ncbi:hypothetical protein [Halobacillus halophilus]|uniref:hypothetical protein n=1 Tax=Halobacillus halophilus TaxID=1570 RepID=UPI001CD8057A|nr:hypothetical protein [Halobacillus halophilus]MCA1011393.1 hypothetical protein [Halobacillus halophilus]
MNIQERFPNSGFPLSDENELSMDYFALHTMEGSGEETQLLSIRASFEGYLFIINGEEELDLIMFGVGVNNIPIRFNPGELYCFVRPIEVTDRTYTVQDVEIRII